jgi:apolipoprotein N-acyltransferase
VAVAVLGWVGFGLWHLHWPVAADPQLSVVLVQGNVQQGEVHDQASALSVFERHLDLTRQGVARAGSGSALVLWRLGKSFSILPEARKLVTGGPYAYVRHPLYSVEIITILGTALQFAAPWSWIIAVIVVVLLWIRSHFEEQVLEQTFPEYAAYRARTKRFIPGVL